MNEDWHSVQFDQKPKRFFLLLRFLLLVLSFFFLKDSCCSKLIFVNTIHKIVSLPMRFWSALFVSQYSIRAIPLVLLFLLYGHRHQHSCRHCCWLDFFFDIIANRLCSVKEIKKEERWQHSVHSLSLSLSFSRSSVYSFGRSFYSFTCSFVLFIRLLSILLHSHFLSVQLDFDLLR